MNKSILIRTCVAAGWWLCLAGAATPTATLRTPTVSGTIRTETITETVEINTGEQNEYWSCQGSQCKILNNDFHESSSGLSATEKGLIAGIVLLGVLCIVVIGIVFVLHSKVHQLMGLRAELEKANKSRYEVKQELSHADETIKAQEAVLQSNVKELQSINGAGPPEGTSANPLANIPQPPLRTTVSDFQTRLGILEHELSEQRRATRQALI